MKGRRPRRIAPRLASGDRRAPLAHGIPPHVKDALKLVAAARNESVSWLLEKAVIDFFGYDEPEYVERKSPDDTPPAPPLRAARRRR